MQKKAAKSTEPTQAYKTPHGLPAYTQPTPGQGPSEESSVDY